MQRIFLVGYRASGKSTVGRLLAAELGWNFYDADDELELRAGRTIREIFADEGEENFRRREVEILQEFSQRDCLVLATGGGVILRSENRQRLRTGFCIWLEADAETLWQRISTDASTGERRPNLAGGGLAEVELMLGRRLPYYQEVGDMRISVVGLSPSEVAAAILAAWKNFSSSISPGSSPTSGSS